MVDRARSLLERLATYTDPAPAPFLLAPRREMARSNSIAYGATAPGPVVRMHPDAAPANGTGLVALTTDHGHVTSAFVADPTVRPGVISMTHGHTDENPGDLTSAHVAVDDLDCDAPRRRAGSRRRGGRGHRRQRVALVSHRGAHRDHDPFEQRARRREVEAHELLARGPEGWAVAQRDTGVVEEEASRVVETDRGAVEPRQKRRLRQPARDARHFRGQELHEQTAVPTRYATSSRNHAPPDRYAASDAAIPSGDGPGTSKTRNARQRAASA